MLGLQHSSILIKNLPRCGSWCRHHKRHTQCPFFHWKVLLSLAAAEHFYDIVWQNYSLVEQPVDILIKKLTKLSIIDININSWSKYQIWQKYQIWPKFQKLTKMSTVDKNVKFDKNIKFDQNINLTKMSNCEPKTACHPYMPRRHQKGIFLSDLYLQLT